MLKIKFDLGYLGYFIGKIHFEEDGVLIQNIFHHGNLQDYQTKLLSL